MATDLQLDDFVRRNDFDGYIIDASLGYPLQFRKVIHRFGGNFDFFGGDPIADAPLDKSILAVLHPQGQALADAFYKQHEAEIDALFWGHHRYGVVLKKQDERKFVGSNADKFITYYLKYHPEDAEPIARLRTLCAEQKIREPKRFHKLDAPADVVALCLRMIIYLMDTPKWKRGSIDDND